jgi:phosphomannomutase/phosphoglucomutase
MEILSQNSQSVDTQFAYLPSAFTTPEIKIFVNDDEKFKLMDRIIELAQFSDASISYLDGIRADFGDGWGLIRASNTTPALFLRFEAESAERLLALKSEFKALLLTADKTLVVDF